MSKHDATLQTDGRDAPEPAKGQVEELEHSSHFVRCRQSPCSLLPNANAT